MGFIWRVGMKIGIVKWKHMAKWHEDYNWRVYYVFNTWKCESDAGKYLWNNAWKEDIVCNYPLCASYNKDLEKIFFELKECGEIEEYIIIEGEEVMDLIEEIEKFIILREII